MTIKRAAAKAEAVDLESRLAPYFPKVKHEVPVHSVQGWVPPLR